MRVAVTGGSGVVGRAVVRHLVAEGYQVKALARSSRSRRVLEALGAEVVEGDLLEFPALDELVADASWVFHIAGINQLCPRDRSEMWRVNVEGTVLVLEACARAGVQRLVYTSSAVTIGEHQGTIGTEASLHRGHFLSEYERSKHQAERLVFERHHGFEAVAVNPSSVQGRGRATGSGSLLVEAARGRMPFLVDATFSIVDIEDCARGHLLAAERGQEGERYLLSAAVTSVRSIVRMLNREMDRDWSPRYLVPGVLKTAAPLLQLYARISGREIPLCPESVRVLAHGHRYDGSRATSDLGLDYRPVETTVAEAVGWFAEQGLI